ncbi:hypothetical protein BDZ91DRAFT_733507 [Kalaharituber pfeilii]|nr:hypothetical protein BDZ91DRAFT_733507 [Kalaharituber pfeilii]
MPAACPFCPRRHFKNLRVHLTKCHPVCTYCSSAAPLYLRDNIAFAQHLDIYHSYSCQVPGCGRKFSSLKGLRGHLVDRHVASTTASLGIAPSFATVGNYSGPTTMLNYFGETEAARPAGSGGGGSQSPHPDLGGEDKTEEEDASGDEDSSSEDDEDDGEDDDMTEAEMIALAEQQLAALSLGGPQPPNLGTQKRRTWTRFRCDDCQRHFRAMRHLISHMYDTHKLFIGKKLRKHGKKLGIVASGGYVQTKRGFFPLAPAQPGQMRKRWRKRRAKGKQGCPGDTELRSRS